MKKYICKECKISFDNQGKYINHIRWNHKNNDTNNMKKAALNRVELLYGKIIEVDIECKWCSTNFKVKYRENGVPPKRKFCKRSCSTSFTNHSRKGIKRSIKSVENQKKSLKKFWTSDKSLEERKNRQKRGHNLLSQEKYQKIIQKNNNTDEIKHQKSIKMSKIASKRIKEGTWNIWNSRNIRSFPELFTEDIIRKRNLMNKCKPEKTIYKKDLGIKEQGHYFLDFYFEDEKIDLEIDGSQHEKRIKEDKIRDIRLQNNGINVYRVKWRNIKSKKGYDLFMSELNDILDKIN